MARPERRAMNKAARPPPAPRAAPRKPPPVKKPKPAASKKADLRAAMGRADAMAGERMLLKEEAVASRLVPSAMVYVREYAHKARAGRKQGDRVDFTETLYWHAGVKTDARGKATVSFELSDAVTSFKVHADGFGQDGAVGAGTGKVESIESFYITPKMPLVVTKGDVIKLPVAMVNGTSSTLSGGSLMITSRPMSAANSKNAFAASGLSRPV